MPETTTKPVMTFKDEGGPPWTTSLLPDGSIPKEGELYEYGTLKTHWMKTRKECKAFAEQHGATPEFA